MTHLTDPRPRHTLVAGMLCLLVALAIGPLLTSGGSGSGPVGGTPSPEGESGVRVEVSAAGVVTGGHGVATLLGRSAPAPSVAGRPSLSQAVPPAPPRALTRPFDRVSYRTTGPPLRVS